MNEIRYFVFFGAILAFLIGFPFAYKENNSWWFTIIKFYFGIVPMIFAGGGILCFGVGIYAAIVGILPDSPIQYTFFTCIYLYCILILVPISYLMDNNPKIYDFFDTL